MAKKSRKAPERQAVTPATQPPGATGHKPIIARWRAAGVVMLTAARIAKGLGVTRASVLSMGMAGVKLGQRTRYYLDDLERTLDALAADGAQRAG